MSTYILAITLVFQIFGGLGFKISNKIEMNFCDSISATERAKVLKIYFFELHRNDAQEKFFDCFPNDFKDFKNVFGYEDVNSVNSVYGPLYDESQDYIDAFFNKLTINCNLFIKRVINIAKEGEWQADGVNIFQLYLKEDVIDHTRDYIEALNNENDVDIGDFWYFYFDGPHPENYNNDFKILHTKINSLNPKIAEIMKQSYEKLLSGQKRHTQ